MRPHVQKKRKKSEYLIDRLSRRELPENFAESVLDLEMEVEQRPSQKAIKRLTELYVVGRPRAEPARPESSTTRQSETCASKASRSACTASMRTQQSTQPSKTTRLPKCLRLALTVSLLLLASPAQGPTASSSSLAMPTLPLQPLTSNKKKH